MRNFTLATIVALAIAILITSMRSLTRNIVFDSETTFWISILVFLGLSILGIFIPKR